MRPRAAQAPAAASGGSPLVLLLFSLLIVRAEPQSPMVDAANHCVMSCASAAPRKPFLSARFIDFR